MGSIPLIASQWTPESPYESYAKMAQLQQQLQAGRQQQQLQQSQLQLQQQTYAANARKQREGEVIRQAFVKNNGDIDSTIKDASRDSNVSPEALQALQQHSADLKAKMQAASAADLSLHKTQTDNLKGLFQPVYNLPANTPPEQLENVYQQQRAIALKSPQTYGIADPSQVPQTFPGKQQGAVLMASMSGASSQLDEALKAAQTREATGKGAQAQAETQKINAETAGGLNQSDNQLYAQSLNPNTPQGQQARAILQRKQQEKIATSVAEGQAKANLASPQRDAARSDRSYQFNNAQLDKVGAPVEAAVQRLGRLQDTLAQNSPQADALVAPELLTVMAGGQGSGLRMNEAEISRIVGGRSKWQSLQAAANKWSLDPKAARSITPEQQAQIHSLVSVVQQKLLNKQKVMDDARQALINSDDPMDHRRIVAGARQKLTQIDETIGAAAPNGPPPGATHKAMGSDKKWHYTNAQGQDLGVAQ
jgi:hypothetical protein